MLAKTPDATRSVADRHRARGAFVADLVDQRVDKLLLFPGRHVFPKRIEMFQSPLEIGRVHSLRIDVPKLPPHLRQLLFEHGGALVQVGEAVSGGSRRSARRVDHGSQPRDLVRELFQFTLSRGLFLLQPTFSARVLVGNLPHDFAQHCRISADSPDVLDERTLQRGRGHRFRRALIPAALVRLYAHVISVERVLLLYVDVDHPRVAACAPHDSRAIPFRRRERFSPMRTRSSASREISSACWPADSGRPPCLRACMCQASFLRRCPAFFTRDSSPNNSRCKICSRARFSRARPPRSTSFFDSFVATMFSFSVRQLPFMRARRTGLIKQIWRLFWGLRRPPPHRDVSLVLGRQ